MTDTAEQINRIAVHPTLGGIQITIDTPEIDYVLLIGVEEAENVREMLEKSIQVAKFNEKP